MDLLLRKNPKHSVNEAQIQERLEKLVQLFKYVDDKDIFQRHYGRLLSRRLIYEASISIEAEAWTIDQLKRICGFEYTSKFQRMLTDMNLCDDLNIAFQGALQGGSSLPTHVLVLTSGSWPLTVPEGDSSSGLTLPPRLASMVSAFEDFYGRRYNGRRLMWLHPYTRLELRLRGFDKSYEVTVSLHQGRILLALNDQAQITLQELQRIDPTLSRMELSLALKPLLELGLVRTDGPTPQGLPYETTLCISINDAFTHAKIKVKVPIAVPTEASSTDPDLSKRAIDEDRKLYIEALIVRIMKAKRELSHTGLIKEVLEQGKHKFIPPIPLIKKSIDHLVEKSFLERHPEHIDQYIYIA